MARKIKNVRVLASRLAKAEGLKSQVKIGDMREVVALLSDLFYQDAMLGLVLFHNGMKRWNKKTHKPIVKKVK